MSNTFVTNTVHTITMLPSIATLELVLRSFGSNAGYLVNDETGKEIRGLAEVLGVGHFTFHSGM